MSVKNAAGGVGGGGLACLIRLDRVLLKVQLLDWSLLALPKLGTRRLRAGLGFVSAVGLSCTVVSLGRNRNKCKHRFRLIGGTHVHTHMHASARLYF